MAPPLSERQLQRRAQFPPLRAFPLRSRTPRSSTRSRVQRTASLVPRVRDPNPSRGPHPSRSSSFLPAPARHAPLLPLAVTDRPATPSSFFSLAEQQPRPSRRDLRRASRPGPTRRGPRHPFFKRPRDPCALLSSTSATSNPSRRRFRPELNSGEPLRPGFPSPPVALGPP